MSHDASRATPADRIRAIVVLVALPVTLIAAALGSGAFGGTARGRALAAFGAHPRVVHEVLRTVPGMWGLFVRLVSGGTGLDVQLERRSVRALVRLLGG